MLAKSPDFAWRLQVYEAVSRSQGHIFMEISPGFEIGKLGNYEYITSSI